MQSKKVTLVFNFILMRKSTYYISSLKVNDIDTSKGCLYNNCESTFVDMIMDNIFS